MNDVLSMEQTLTERYGRDWDLYRNHENWSVRIRKEHVRGANIVEALQAAVAYVEPAPEVPPMPEPLTMDRFQPIKDGSNWRLHYDGQECYISVKTKKAALEHAEKLINLRNLKRSQWLERYGSAAA